MARSPTSNIGSSKVVGRAPATPSGSRVLASPIAPLVGPFEILRHEVGAFEMRPAEVGAAKVRHPQIQAPLSQRLTLSPGIRAAAEDLENRCDVRCRRGRTGSGGHLRLRRFWFFPPRPFAHERRQHFHHRPIQVGDWICGKGVVSMQQAQQKTPPPGR